MSAFADFLMDTQVLKLGDFRLKSGKRSPYFLNFGEVRTGKALCELGSRLARLCMDRVGPFDAVYGPPYKAISLAVATCTALWSEHQVDRPFLTYRKEEKTHGEGGLFLGHQLRGGDRVVMVDDVMTSGGTKVEALERLQDEARRLGVEPPRCVALLVGVDRQERDDSGRTAAEVFTAETGIPVLALARVSEVFDSLRGRRLSEEDYQKVKAFL